MRTSRILAYGAIGIIAGLLIENKALLTRENVKDGARKLKKKLDGAMHKLHNED